MGCLVFLSVVGVEFVAAVVVDFVVFVLKFAGSALSSFFPPLELRRLLWTVCVVLLGLLFVLCFLVFRLFAFVVGFVVVVVVVVVGLVVALVVVVVVAVVPLADVVAVVDAVAVVAVVGESVVVFLSFPPGVAGCFFVSWLVVR